MQSVADFLKSLGVQYAPLIATLIFLMGSAAYYVLQKKLEASIAHRLEKTKHELQLDYQKMSVVFEHQKDSFRKVLVAMHQAVEAIDCSDGHWHPISQDRIDTFRRLIAEESLFMDTESDHALRIFVDAMRRAAEEPFDAPPDQEEIGRAYTHTEFIAERLSDHFRSRVGLAPAHLNYLVDVELLGACRLINGYTFPGYNLPTKGPLAYRPNGTASQLVAACKQNPEILRTELEQLKNAIGSKENWSRSFFHVGIEADLYLKTLQVITTEAQRQSIL